MINPSIIDAADAIQGWSTRPELEWLANLAASRPVGIEVGCWKGRSTLALAGHVQTKLYAIDHWRGNRENLEVEHREAVELGPDRMFELFKANVQLYITAGTLVPLQMPSVDAAAYLVATLGRAWADFVFIDAGHTDEEVTKDILAYAPLVKPDGVVCGHDGQYVTNTLRKVLGNAWHIEVDTIWQANRQGE